MKEVHFFYSPNAVAETQLPPDESLHALRVLRLKEGDEIYLLDGKGFFYNAVISMVASKKCFYEIKERLDKIKAIRSASSSDRIRKMAEKPYLFCQSRQSKTSCETGGRFLVSLFVRIDPINS